MGEDSLQNDILSKRIFKTIVKFVKKGFGTKVLKALLIYTKPIPAAGMR